MRGGVGRVPREAEAERIARAWATAASSCLAQVRDQLRFGDREAGRVAGGAQRADELEVGEPADVVEVQRFAVAPSCAM